MLPKTKNGGHFPLRGTPEPSPLNRSFCTGVQKLVATPVLHPQSASGRVGPCPLRGASKPSPLNRPPPRALHPLPASGSQVLLEFGVVSESNEPFQRHDTYKRCMNEVISKTS